MMNPEEASSPRSESPLGDVDCNDVYRGVENTADSQTFVQSDQSIQQAIQSSDGDSSFPRIPGYGIERKLGQGGMGAVYLAVDQSLDRQVAVKVVAQHAKASQSTRSRFEAEVKALASLQHPNIARLYYANLMDEAQYFIMEFVDGPTLEEYAIRPLPADEAAGMAVKLAKAVAYCHSQGVLHRDLKPSNVLLNQSHEPKVADFGLAKVLDSNASSTQTGEVLGTPSYMAPEQAAGRTDSISVTTDVYALGAIIYRLITGRPPFVAAEPLRVMLNVIHEDPVKPRQLVPDVPMDLQTICLKCLEKIPARRYASVRELAEDLERFLSGHPVLARPAGQLERAVKWAKRNPTLALLISACAAGLFIAISGLAWHNNSLARELARTTRLANRGSDLSEWLIGEHMNDLNAISGTTASRLAVAIQVRDFLESSFNDMPADAKYTRRLGVTYARLASVTGGEDHNNVGDVLQAEAYYQKAIQLLSAAEELDPQNLSNLKHRILAMVDLAALYDELQQPEKKESYQQQAEAAVRALPTSDWESRFVRAFVLQSRTESCIERNQIEDAMSLLEQIQEQLDKEDNYADTNEIEFENLQIWHASNLAACLGKTGRLTEAEDALRQAVELSRSSAESATDDPLRRRRLATMELQLGDNMMSQQRFEEALENYGRSLTVVSELAEQDPASVELQVERAVKLSRICSVHETLGDLDAAAHAIEEARAIHQKLNEAGKTAQSNLRATAIYTRTLATIRMSQLQYDEAMRLLDEHRSMTQDLMDSNPDSIPELVQLAENDYYRASVLMSKWVGSTNLAELENPRDSSAYAEIQQALLRSLNQFDRIESMATLDYNQQQFRASVVKLQELLVEFVNQLDPIHE